ncbi:[Fe-Fe] hydrogenase large subunit C-terminal domain-containing protein [Syntrophotalea acetylenica]|jgi:DNA-binding NtrC family response regulator/iron only hydrogenase large subunit-like protein|uniref:[Fe-Fe] hydrogenase large subunit C-terminal domain-containing protein n=1 Tax=Syntrophotalea acetylenica TaxID=29542 RepID=UPI002A360890|nr:[Fe-Fe] hydrogenase large subunit C-terminal domain-containing protein [Syntrophotalea acetylenica]MDY0263269.1 [Fe-Fe] hydrogenase large subunit C-terminal domain-containing protein [Syntrophotalea acetylenica]
MIQTDIQRCRSCFACLRHCPVKAVRVTPQGTDTDAGRCIGCGRCLQVCSQQARRAPNSLNRCQRLLRHKEPMAAILAPSFPAYIGDMRPGQLVSGLHRLGFQLVVEGAWGVELAARAIAAGLRTVSTAPRILSHCPAIVALVERHFPQLLRNLSPCVSPLVAAARALRATHAGPLRIVTISSCFAAKIEAADDQFQDVIDGALTFAEIGELFETAGITPTRLPETVFDQPHARSGRRFALSGGAPTSLLPRDYAEQGEMLSTEGYQNAREVLLDLAAGRIRPGIVDLRLCRGGCLGACDPGSRLSAFARGRLVEQFARQHDNGPRPEPDAASAKVNLKRTFSNRQTRQEHPSGESIRRVLQSTDKFSQRDELNCGACGYRTCREHATAVCRSLAREDMCLPYFVKRLKAEQARLQKSAQLAQQAAEEVMPGDDLLARQLLDLVQEVAPGDKTILLRGEMGTGKKTAARTIHRYSRRAEQPLATLSCSGLDQQQLLIELFGSRHASDFRQGLLELAAGGTLLLEEIGDAGQKVQDALLEFLNHGSIMPVGAKIRLPVDVRLIVTSRRDLEQGVKEGWFSSDLYYRLCLCTLTLPPLRNRPQALQELAEQLLRRSGRRLNRNPAAIDAPAMEALCRYAWPGNILELAAVIERAVILGGDDPVLRREHLSLPLAAGASAPQPDPGKSPSDFRARRGRQMELIERDLLERYLRESSGNVSAAARRANLPRRTFYRLMERYDIQRCKFLTRPAARKGD